MVQNADKHECHSFRRNCGKIEKGKNGQQILFPFRCPLVIVPNTVRFKTEVGGSNFVTHRREGDHWGDLGLDGWIILGWISRRWDVGIWTGLGWPRIETGGGQL